MLHAIKQISVIGFAALLLTATATSIASAHVVVKPAEVVTAGFQTFSVGVPNEKSIAVTSVRLVMPKGLKYVQPTQKSGWVITVDSTGSGDDATVSALIWQGGEIAPGYRDEFTFSAQVPEKAAELQWKAYQTYADGTTVAWDKAGENEESDTSGPFSVTKVVTTSESDAQISAAGQVAEASKGTADTALYVSIAALLVAVASAFVKRRK